MLSTSAAYRSSIGADERQFRAKVLVYFNPNNPVVFTQGADPNLDRVSDLHLLCEAGAQTDNPLPGGGFR